MHADGQHHKSPHNTDTSTAADPMAEFRRRQAELEAKQNAKNLQDWIYRAIWSVQTLYHRRRRSHCDPMLAESIRALKALKLKRSEVEAILSCSISEENWRLIPWFPPSKLSIGQLLKLTQDERVRWKLWWVRPCDRSEQELRQEQDEREKQRRKTKRAADLQAIRDDHARAIDAEVRLAILRLGRRLSSYGLPITVRDILASIRRSRRKPLRPSFRVDLHKSLDRLEAASLIRKLTGKRGQRCTIELLAKRSG
jgi:hypothetical protein